METRKSNPKQKLKNTVISIIENFGNVSEKEVSKVTVDKFDKILSLVSCNIKLSSDKINFDTNEFRIDKATVFNYKMKYTSTGQLNSEDMKDLNLYFQKHKNIAKILIAN